MPKKEMFVGEIRMRNKKGNMKTFKAVSHFEYQLYKKIQNGFSPIIIICGSQRIGKSALALNICNKYTKFMYEESFNFEKYSFYDTKKAIVEMKTMIMRAMLIDEGGESLDYLDWYKRIAKAMRSMINTQAFRGNIYVIISPFVVEILKNIRKHFDFKLVLTSRGRFKAFKYMKKYGAEKQEKATYPIFLDDLGFHLSDLPKGMFDKYKEFSEKEKEKIRQGHESELVKTNSIIKNMIKEIRKEYI